jgi:hypothetical protein
MVFDKEQFSRDFYTYIKDNCVGGFNGNYDELYNMYTLNYVSNIIDRNTEEQNKQIAEEFGILKDRGNTPYPGESYSLYAYYAYGNLWNYVVREFPVCEYSDAETDSDTES